MPPTRQPYAGLYRKLVLAFDVGTTFSGVSYCLCDPGETPVIWTVTSFPAQTESGGESKIPSILYYDRNGTVCAVGEEAQQLGDSGEADDNEWIRVEWFKLHLRPRRSGTSNIDESAVPPLPLNKSATEVVADFLAYLYRCTQDFIKKTHHAGEEMLQSVEGHIEFVLGHPNGWEGPQQQSMRRAAILAGLVPDTQDGRSHVHFVTEGEASLHYCVNHGLSSTVIQPGSAVMIVDAGGGTIDLSSFVFKKTDPISVEEIAPTGCCIQGSVLVDRRAYHYLENEKLAGSAYDDPQDIERIVDCFSKTVKRRFRQVNEMGYVKFGTNRDDDPEFGIRRGVLKLAGTEIAALFEPSIQAIFEAIEEQRSTATHRISAILLVGGFASSDWLFSKVADYARPLGLEVSRPDGYTNKAVADGAVSYFIDRFVSARIAKWTYGSRCTANYNHNNPEHVRRSHNTHIPPSGQKQVLSRFSAILHKGVRVSEDKEFRKNFLQEAYTASSFNELSTDITVYRGRDSDPQWTDVEPAMFSDLCTVIADTSALSRTLNSRTSSAGSLYYRVGFDIVLLFGLTELKAQICWQENGQERRSPARVVYDDQDL